MYQDPQVDFYKKILKGLLGKKIVAAAPTKSGQSFYIRTEDGQELIFYGRIGDSWIPVDIEYRQKGLN